MKKPINTTEEFLSTPVNHTEQTDCSPQLADGDIGIIITAPDQATAAVQDGVIPLSKLPVCIAYTVEAKHTFGQPEKSIVIQSAVNDKLQYRAELNLSHADDAPPEPEPDDVPGLTEEELEGIEASGYVTVLLSDFIELPQSPHKYFMWVEWGSYTSNKHNLKIE